MGSLEEADDGQGAGATSHYPLQALAALPDGRLMGVGKDRTIGMLDLDTGEHQVLTGKYTGLVSGGRDGTIRLWNLDMGEHQVLKKKHTRLIQES